MDHCTGRFPSGVLAQLGARNIRIVEATGSNPVYSIVYRRYLCGVSVFVLHFVLHEFLGIPHSFFNHLVTFHNSVLPSDRMKSRLANKADNTDNENSE